MSWRVGTPNDPVVPGKAPDNYATHIRLDEAIKGVRGIIRPGYVSDIEEEPERIRWNNKGASSWEHPKTGVLVSHRPPLKNGDAIYHAVSKELICIVLWRYDGT
jgi:hypothetical protein